MPINGSGGNNHGDMTDPIWLSFSRSVMASEPQHLWVCESRPLKKFGDSILGIFIALNASDFEHPTDCFAIYLKMLRRLDAWDDTDPSKGEGFFQKQLPSL